MFKATLIALSCILSLSACQTFEHQTAITLNASSVDSWHFGYSAQGQSYLLVVLNPQTQRYLQTHHGALLLLNQQSFKAPIIQGGFLVLNPLPAQWGEQQIAQFLN